MTEGPCNGDAVKHLVTNCFPNAISHACSGGMQQVARRNSRRMPTCACGRVSPRALQKEANLKRKDKDGTKKKGQGDRTVQKMFAESILNTVVEVTIYLMPAKLARTSGAGYLVQLFMISSKI